MNTWGFIGLTTATALNLIALVGWVENPPILDNHFSIAVGLVTSLRELDQAFKWFHQHLATHRYFATFYRQNDKTIRLTH